VDDVVFYNVAWPYPTLARYLVESVRRWCPGARVTQLSDPQTPEVPNVDRVVRASHPFGAAVHYAGYQYLAESAPSPCLFVDLDMAFNGPFEVPGEADVALAPRARRDGLRTRHKQRYPYCSAMYVTHAAFWQECFQTMLEFGRRRAVCDNMEAVGLVVGSGRYRVQHLDPALYNKIPHDRQDYDPAARIYHFKSRRRDDRKTWMAEFCQRHLNGEAHG
jgi:hypothetical protein